MRIVKHSDTILAVTLKRTTIFLRRSTLAKLKKLSRQTGAPIAELIRRSVEMFLEKELPKKKK